MNIKKWLNNSGVLHRVSKPSRYFGNELNIKRKKVADKLRFLFVFPDTYEIGMSHTGLKILYRILNESADIYAERAFLPWKDMFFEMKNNNIPLYSLETYSSANSFDIIGITLQYELSYTNILGILDLCNIPFFSVNRTDEPLIVGGGPCMINPEPVSDFFDFFVIGDGEEITLDVSKIIKENLTLLREGRRGELLSKIGKLDGIYVPQLNQKSIKKKFFKSLSDSEIETRPIVPFYEIVHDRASIELLRGCSRSCRFCAAGFFYRPVRERTYEEIIKAVPELIENTGYGELSLLSLSTMDYTSIKKLTNILYKYMSESKISLSLPSTRVDNFGIEIASKIASIKKTGLTFAPEAGTQRMRDIINKNISEKDIISTAKKAFDSGWERIKLYFMIGLPTERDEDIYGIVDLSRMIKRIGFRQLNVSVGIFIPKPFTPFQFEKQISIEEAKEKIKKLYVINKFGKLSISDPKKATIEGIFSRGDRKLSSLIVDAYNKGCIYDEWTEEFDYNKWVSAFEKSDISPENYLSKIPYEKNNPWEKIDMGIDKDFLISENKKALLEKTTADCRWNDCSNCGICMNFNLKNILNE
ncbi:MAG: hypothetical protein PWQ77_991 [Kosmotogales bacterium]|nr:hypothetical protein [Kosmotogales bacterium]